MHACAAGFNRWLQMEELAEERRRLLRGPIDEKENELSLTLQHLVKELDSSSKKARSLEHELHLLQTEVELNDRLSAEKEELQQHLAAVNSKISAKEFQIPVEEIRLKTLQMSRDWLKASIIPIKQGLTKMAWMNKQQMTPRSKRTDE